MLNKKMLLLAICLFVIFPSVAFADDEEDGLFLTGDTKLACEAILCLSSPHPPSECAAALTRYFGINKKTWSKTVKARRNFLNLCPSASTDNKD